VASVHIYTDGSSRGNPGPGGYGTILMFGDHYKELSKGYQKTTNNRMELLAVIAGLEALKQNSYPVVVFSDSKYVVDSIEKGWLWGWVKKDFKGKKNRDLWERYIPLHKKFKIKFTWVKGHAGHPQNERCDELAVMSAEGKDLKVDQGYLEALS
jgi:ribonuclease HI